MALVNEYTFGEMTGTSLVDSIGTNNGTLGGATLPTWTKSLDLSKVRTQLDFTGGNGATAGDRQRVNLVSSNFEYNGGSNFSYVIIFKSSKLDGNYHSLYSYANSFQYSYTCQEILIRDTEDLLITFGAGNGPYRQYIGTFNVCDGKWHCLILTYDGTSKTLTPYFDGGSFSATASGTLSGTANFYNSTSSKPVLGSRAVWGTSNYRDDLTGSIAYFANYNHTLSAAEVQRITEEQLYKVYSRDSGATYRYLPPRNANRDGLVNEYFLDSPDGTDTVSDYQGTNDGTKGGATKPASAVAPNGMNSLTFSGGNGSTGGDRQRVEFTRTPFEYSTSSNFSIAVLFKSSKSDNVKHLVFGVQDISGVNGNIIFRIEENESIVIGVQSSDGNYKYWTPSAVCDGKWHLAVMTFASSGLALNVYIDGVLRNENALAVGTMSGNFYTSNSKALLGANWRQSDSKYYNDLTGSIAYFANYNRVLSATEVDKMYRDLYLN